MFYPFKFDNIYIPKIWGSRDLELYRTNMPQGEIGESFDVSCYEKEMSTVINGEYAGVTLKKLIEKLGTYVVGDKMPKDALPVIIRLVTPREKLSVQVHPTDEYAKRKGMEMGKTEAWYVMETFENPFVYVGTKNCTEEEFKKSIVSSDVEKHMKRYNVKKGDVFFLESGIVHAMGQDVIMVEIGQNSNTTYRIYDYNRGREVDIDDALNVINLDIKGGVCSGVNIEYDGYNRKIYFVHKAFAWELFDIKRQIKSKTCEERFEIYTCVQGCGIIKYSNGKSIEYIKCGDSVLMPAYLGEYEIFGKLQLLKSYVPDVKKAKQEMYSSICV